MDTNMTAAEMLEYYKNEVFKSMGIDIEGLQNKDADYQKWARVSVADQMLGQDANGDFARQHAFNFFDSNLNPVKENPLVQKPQEGLAEWLVDLMRLLAYLLVNDPFSHPFDLNWLDSRFKPMGEDGAKQFSPSNQQLIDYLTTYTRTGCLVAKMVKTVACLEASKIDNALFDYYVYRCRKEDIDFTDGGSCFGYIDRLRDTIDDVNLHIRKGHEQGLTKEEIGLVDSLWTEIPHNYPGNYVAAAREIWEKIKPIRENFGDGRKNMKDCDLYIKDMIELILPIAEKHKVDMELDDEYSLPLAYLKDWLTIIYKGHDIIYR